MISADDLFHQINLILEEVTKFVTNKKFLLNHIKVIGMTRLIQISELGFPAKIN